MLICGRYVTVSYKISSEYLRKILTKSANQSIKICIYTTIVNFLIKKNSNNVPTLKKNIVLYSFIIYQSLNLHISSYFRKSAHLWSNCREKSYLDSIILIIISSS